MHKIKRRKQLPHTLIIRRLVKPENLEAYEKWLKSAVIGIKAFKGCIGVYVLKPLHTHHPEYDVIIQFDSTENLKGYEQSELHKIWFKELEKISIGKAFQKSYSAFDTLFIRGYPQHILDIPPRYKTFILTFICAYPIILIVSFALSLMPINLTSPIKILLTLFTTLAICLFLVLPYTSKVFEKWLSPT